VDIRDKADDVGNESVTTPAGTFTAHHYRMKDGSGDFWLSEKVSPYGLIKGQGKDFTMVLTKVVTDAKDKITGTPVPFSVTSQHGGGMVGPRATGTPAPFSATSQHGGGMVGPRATEFASPGKG